MRGHCESCAFWDGTYCCGGYSADEDLTIDEIYAINKEAEEKGLIVDWKYDKCEYWEEYEEDDSWEDVAFDNWRESQWED